MQGLGANGSELSTYVRYGGESRFSASSGTVSEFIEFSEFYKSSDSWTLVNLKMVAITFDYLV